MPESGGTPTNRMELSVPSLPANAELCRAAVAVFAASLPFTLGEIEELKIAVGEAVGNCTIHAYRADDPGPVRLCAELRGGAVVVEVADQGRGIADVARARQEAFTTSDDPDHIGMGFTFMEQFTDALEVQSTPGRGTLVRLTKRPADAPPAGGAR